MQDSHKGHRDRVKKQFLAEGFSENTPPHKLLEMLLFYCIPQKDTNELAHTLLAEFGSFKGVLDAPVRELVKFPGITENSVCLLKLIMPAARLYCNSEMEKENFANLSAAAEYLASKFVGRTIEAVFLLCLDNRGRMLACTKLSEGDEISVGVTARMVVEEVLKNKATAVMLAHNHPKGFALPSPADIRRTTEISTALFHIGVNFLDHIIVADNDYVSLAQSKEYKFLFDKGRMKNV